MRLANKDKTNSISPNVTTLKLPKGVLVGTLFQVVSSINSQTGAGEEVYQVIPDCYSTVEQTEDEVILKPYGGCVDLLKEKFEQQHDNGEEEIFLRNLVKETFRSMPMVDNCHETDDLHLMRNVQAHSNAMAYTTFSNLKDDSLDKLPYAEVWKAVADKERIILSKTKLIDLANNYPNHTITITPKFLAEEAHSGSLKESGFYKQKCNSTKAEECFSKSLALVEFFTLSTETRKRAIQFTKPSEDNSSTHDDIVKLLVGVIPNDTKARNRWQLISV